MRWKAMYIAYLVREGRRHRLIIEIMGINASYDGHDNRHFWEANIAHIQGNNPKYHPGNFTSRTSTGAVAFSIPRIYKPQSAHVITYLHPYSNSREHTSVGSRLLPSTDGGTGGYGPSSQTCQATGARGSASQTISRRICILRPPQRGRQLQCRDKNHQFKSVLMAFSLDPPDKTSTDSGANAVPLLVPFS